MLRTRYLASHKIPSLISNFMVVGKLMANSQRLMSQKLQSRGLITLYFGKIKPQFVAFTFRMHTFIRRISVLVVALVSLLVARAADEVTFKTNVQMISSVGEQVRVEFVLSAMPDDNSFVPPAFDNFDIVAGPAISKGSSIQIVNGKTTRSVSYTITYVLLPRQSGTFTIGSASTPQPRQLLRCVRARPLRRHRVVRRERRVA